MRGPVKQDTDCRLVTKSAGCACALLLANNGSVTVSPASRSGETELLRTVTGR